MGQGGWPVTSRCYCHSSLSSPTSSESVFIKTCWQDLHAPNEDWSCGLMLNLGIGGLSEKLWECPLIYISHTLRSLRTTWEHIKNAYTWFLPPGDADCINMELGPVTCVFITSLGGVLKQGATDHLEWLRRPCSTVLLLPLPTPDASVSPASSELWPWFIFVYLWAGAWLWFCYSVVYRHQLQGIAHFVCGSCSQLSLLIHSWFSWIPLRFGFWLHSVFHHKLL